jgi:hypothetical protein
VGDGVVLLSPRLHGGDLGFGRPVACRAGRSSGATAGSSSGEAQPELSRRSVVAVDAFPEGEQVVELRGRAIEAASGRALLR